MVFKIDQLTTIVKSAQKLENQKGNKGKSLKQTPKKSDGLLQVQLVLSEKVKSHFNVGIVVVGDIQVVNVPHRET